MARTVIMNITPNAGYAADQVVARSITLADLLEAVQEMIEIVGEDAVIATHEGARYGATWGYIHHDVFEEATQYPDVDMLASWLRLPAERAAERVMELSEDIREEVFTEMTSLGLQDDAYFDRMVEALDELSED